MIAPEDAKAFFCLVRIVRTCVLSRDFECTYCRYVL